MNRHLFSLCALSVIGCATLGATTYNYVELSGITASSPAYFDIGNQGQLLGTISNLGFVQTSSGFTTFAYPGAVATDAYGINDSGVIVGQEQGNTTGYGFLRSATGAYTLINPTNSIVSWTYAVNNAGVAVGVYLVSGDDSFGYVWQSGTITVISLGDGTFTTANGINNQGTIVGTYSNGNNQYGYSLTDGNLTSFQYPGGLYTYAESINDSGEIAGFFENGSAQSGFVLTAAGYQSIDYPGAKETTVTSINNAGDVLGRFLDDANGVSTGGYFEAIPGTNTPEPASIGLVTIAILALRFGWRGVLAGSRRE